MSLSENKPPVAWGLVPAVPVAGALGAGILVADWTGSKATTPWLLAGLMIALILLLALQWKKPSGWGPPVSSLLVLCLVFSFGGWRTQQVYAPNHATFFAHQLDAEDVLAGRIEAIRAGETNLRLQVRLTAVIRDSGIQQAVCGKILLYLPPDEQSARLATGDELVFSGTPRTLRPPLNPGVFDLRAYWHRQGIYHQLFLRETTSWRLTGRNSGSLYARAQGWRRAWFKTFQRHLKGDRLAVAAALVLGKRDLISEEVKSAYTDTGAVHVLAVSGLHVGIIYLLLRFMLLGVFKLDRRPKGRLVVALLSIICVWLFALVSGLSPSVQRAAIMFSIIALGGLSYFKSHVFNTLAVAAILMLAWDPGQLFQVGFQLSFTAIIGIVAFTNYFNRLVFWPYRLLRGGWSAMAASTGAQLGTLPLSLLYFGQFPAYFLLSGTIVILFAFATMFAGLAHGLIAGLLGMESLAVATGWLLRTIVGLQNALIFGFSELPGALLKVPFFDGLSALLLALAICFGAVYLHWRRRSMLLLAGGCLLALFIWAGTQVQGKDKGTVVTVFHCSRSSLLDVVTADGRAWSFGHQPAAKDLAWTAGPFRQARDYVPEGTLPLLGPDTLLTETVGRKGQQLVIGNSRWQILDGTSNAQVPDAITTATHLLVSNGFKPQNFPVLPPSRRELLLVVDGSNPYYRLAEWKTWAAATGIKVHLTAEDGAYQYQWQASGADPPE